MKNCILLILVLVATNLYGQKIVKKSKMIINHSKENLYELSDSINFTDFEVTYNWNNDEKYSTIDSTFIRRYLEGERSVKFILTKEEKALIYKTVKLTDFLNLPEVLEMENDVFISPSFSTKIIIRIGKITHEVYDSSGLIQDMSIEKRFSEVVSIIENIINDKKEVKNLPKSNRVYL